MAKLQAPLEHYIVATSPRAPDLNQVLKHDDAFALFDPSGDMGGPAGAADGFYVHGTRFLSGLHLTLYGVAPLVLSSRVAEDNDRFSADLTNSDYTRNDVVVLPRDVLHLLRSRFVWQGALYERVHVWSYQPGEVEATLGYAFHADFADIFEVRGTARRRRGSALPALVRPDSVVFAYRGLDDVLRATTLVFEPAPRQLDEETATFTLRLTPGAPQSVTLRVTSAFSGDDVPRVLTPVRHAVAGWEAGRARSTYDSAVDDIAAALDEHACTACALESSNQQFNAWVARSASDIRMMLTSMDTGPYPYAGVPWFSTAFGRDGIITALELLAFDPSIARGVLTYLAALQSDRIDPAADAEPGKILYEVRGGEMPALGEVPFRRYYGSIDATPLFVMLAGAYYRRTGDRAFVDEIWPHVERARAWIDDYGDLDGDGFVEYTRRSAHGLVQQGWKDSSDSVFHRDGESAVPPIGLCEVQGYVYAARQAAARLATARGDTDRAGQLQTAAADLKRRFDETFWLDDLGTYALAICGDKRACRVKTSNAGHALYTGIAEPSRAKRLAETLFETTSFSGWGVRTVATTESRYNPLSYHNGSIWPHDNALIAAGLARYGLVDQALRLFGALFDASRSTRLHRLPELFCGFERRAGDGPTLYPVACAPQAWAAGAVFLLVQSCLGLSINAPRGRVSLRHARLPPFVSHLTIRNLQVGEANVDLRCERQTDGIGVRVLRRRGSVEVLVRK